MSPLVGYELHTYRGGVWKIDSVYDDREIAVFEAQRVHESGRYSAVRVVEERFDPATDETKTKTVFRASKSDSENAEVLERKKAARREVRQARKPSEVGDFKPSGRTAAPAASAGPGAVGLVLILSGLLLAGIGVILGLRYLFGAV